MIKIEKTEVVGLEAAIRGMRNPMNSWDRSDSHKGISGDSFEYDPGYVIGEADMGLAKKLAKAGKDHRKFMRMIVVYVDITAPLYWWKEFDTYKVGTVSNSCSTMHKIGDKEFTRDDFSIEHLGVTIPETDEDGACYQNLWPVHFDHLIEVLNIARGFFNRTEDKKIKKQYWWQMIQLLPTSYNQRRTIMLNYEVLNNIYYSRRGHKLDEWRVFCEWIESLPYSEVIIGEK